MNDYDATKQARALRSAARLLLKHKDEVGAIDDHVPWDGATSVYVGGDGVAHIHANLPMWQVMSKGRTVSPREPGRQQVTINGVVVFQ